MSVYASWLSPLRIHERTPIILLFPTGPMPVLNEAHVSGSRCDRSGSLVLRCFIINHPGGTRPDSGSASVPFAGVWIRGAFRFAFCRAVVIMAGMCANYEVKEPDFEAFAELKLSPQFPPFKPSLFPGYDVPVFRADGPCLLRWGLVPSWSKTEKAEFSTFNARSENVQKSPVFRTPFAKRRCLMPASSFFEWTKTKP